MKIDFKHFQENLPAHVNELLALCIDNDIEPSIIGGIPRDYILNQSIGSDFDICIRPLKSIDQRESFNKILLDKYKDADEKKFGVIDLGNGIEISYPRIEIFNGDIDHSNFEVEFIQDLDYAKDVLRRDFTLNAISFTYKNNVFNLNDPLGGVNDIHTNVLRACSYQNFVKDPVRFLRAIRFHILLDFEFETNTEEVIKNMHLKFSAHYLKYEAKKSKRPITFLLMIDYFQGNYLSIDFEDMNDEILDYENNIVLDDLHEHIRHLYFLSVPTRRNILMLLELKSTQIWNIPFANIDLFELKKLDLEHFPKLSYIQDLIKFLENAHMMDKKILTYFNFINPVSPQFYQDYSMLQIAIPQGVQANMRSFYILKEKLKESL